MESLRLAKLLGLAVVASGLTQGPAAEDVSWKVLIDVSNSFRFSILAGDQAAMTAGTVGWGPNWSWFNIGSDRKATGGQLSISSPMEIGGQKPEIALNVQPGGPRQVVFEYVLRAENDVPIQQIVATIGVAPGVHAKAILDGENGSDRSTDLPMGIADFGLVKKLEITAPGWRGPVAVNLEPPLVVGGDRDLRIKLASETLKAGTTRMKVIWTFPGDVSLLLGAGDVMKYAPVLATRDWFPYRPKWDTGKSSIGMQDWLDKPAGKRGGVRTRGDQFVLGDGTPIKFWGMNLSYGSSAPTRHEAEFTAARFAKYGVNAVRMHKFTGAGWEGIGDEHTAVMMKPEGLNRLDYFASQLSKRGVYYGWSHSYQFKIRPGDRARVAGFDELMRKGGNTYGVINWAEDVQDLMIEMVVNLLKHRNPYTKKTYAQDHALCFIELQNEDDIFFYTSESAYKDFPTYRQLLQARFAEWLRGKYGSQDRLAAAWGNALQMGEQITRRNIALQMNPWFMSDAHLPQSSGGERLRLLDNAAFLHETQNRFYGKFVKAIREAGYEGPLVGSPWQAPGMLPHYANLRSDSLVGYIDRHNYFGEVLNDTMLKTPGSGYLSSGLQQVAGQPFGVSEWIHVYPSLYSAEGPVIMAAYGMGLQGWGSSYEFQSTSGSLDPATAIVGNQPFGVWNADVPAQLGLYPVLSRMIFRGDVKTAPVISTRRVSPENLAKGEFDFRDVVKQQGDIKTFTGSVSSESLAAGRTVVEFGDNTSKSSFPNMTRYMHGSVITSATGQLRWDTSGGGVITINTLGTQGYVGFAQGHRLNFDDVVIEPASPYAAIIITAASPKARLGDDTRVLIAAIARNANQGFRVLTLDNRTIVDNGRPPIMLEPVRADIAFTKRKLSRVNVLDHDGKLSGRTLHVTSGKFTIDSASDHAIYYEVILAGHVDPEMLGD